MQAKQQQVDPKAWDLFRSPCCGKPLQNGKVGLRCGGCNQVYPVTDGIPVLLPSAAFNLCSECGEVLEKGKMDGLSCSNCGPLTEGAAL